MEKKYFNGQTRSNVFSVMCKVIMKLMRPLINQFRPDVLTLKRHLETTSKILILKLLTQFRYKNYKSQEQQDRFKTGFKIAVRAGL